MHVMTNVKAGVFPGSYIYDCTDLNTYRSENGTAVLSARCRDLNGLVTPSSITVPEGFSGNILNCDGRLSLDHC